MCKFVLPLILFLACVDLTRQQARPDNLSFFKPDNPFIQYGGRIDFTKPEKPKLSGAASYSKITFRGSSFTIELRIQNMDSGHDYIAVVLDEKYIGRMRIDGKRTRYQVADSLSDKNHTCLICKATESQIGFIEFQGISCKQLLPCEKEQNRKIEYIGDSITCGMGMETAEIPCNSAGWYDQHNAYLAYGPLAARKLDADWLLSSVSGIGMTRYWNKPGPTMPHVYQNIFLDANSTLWDFKKYTPDLVSICLGTNDIGDGDGSYNRAPLDSSQFVNDYVQFLKRVRKNYPSAQLCCLSSPMVTGEHRVLLDRYLAAIVNHMRTIEKDQQVHLFLFADSYTSGCDTHPDKQEHEMMARELAPFYKEVMGW